MFWGLTMEAGKRYSQKVASSFHISMAALEPGAGEKTASLMLEKEGTEFLICSLVPKKVMQQVLDLNFIQGEEVTFFVNGAGSVHLSGYIIGDEDDFPSDGDDEEESESEEEESFVKNSVPVKKQQQPTKPEMGTKRKLEDSSIAKTGNAQKKPFMLKDDEDDDDSSDDDDISSFDGDSDDDIDPEEMKKQIQKMVAEAKKSIPAQQKGKQQNNNNSKLAMMEEDDSDDSTDDSDDDSDDTPKQKQQTPKQQPKKPQQGNQQQQKTPNQKAAGQMQKPQQQQKTPNQQKQQSPKKDGKQNQTPKGQNNNTQTPKGANSTLNTSNNSEPGSGKKKRKKNKKNKAGNDNNKTLSPAKEGGESKGDDSKQILPTGTALHDLRAGNGPEAKPGRIIHAYYTGRLQKNNSEFDKCVEGKPFKFRLGAGEVIKGWDDGFKGMKVGGRRRIVVPPSQGYGSKSIGGIPPNSTLVFDVELKAVS